MTTQDTTNSNYIANLIQQAKQGCPYAQYDLAGMYRLGNSIKQDREKADYWYKESVKSFTKLATNGDKNAQYKLGDLYFCGHGVKQDKEKAVHWYAKSADQGNTDAQEQLGIIYYIDEDIKQDDEKSIYYTTLAAEDGALLAQELLRNCFSSDKEGVLENLGDILYDVKQEYHKSAFCYKKSAKNNNKTAQYKLGCMYYDGKGVKKNDKNALYWLRKSAKQGYYLAQLFLGVMDFKGKKDYKDSKYYLKKFVEQINNLEKSTEKYKIKMTNNALKDKEYWKNTNSKKFKRIERLITACKQNPYKGIGRPKKYYGKEIYSRRIDKEHRLFYYIKKQMIIVLQCKKHDFNKQNYKVIST